MTKNLQKNLILILFGLLVLSGLFLLSFSTNNVKTASADWLIIDEATEEVIPGKDTFYRNGNTSLSRYFSKSILAKREKNFFNVMEKRVSDDTQLKDDLTVSAAGLKRTPTDLYFNRGASVLEPTEVGIYPVLAFGFNRPFTANSSKIGLRQYSFYLYRIVNGECKPIQLVRVTCQNNYASGHILGFQDRTTCINVEFYYFAGYHAFDFDVPSVENALVFDKYGAIVDETVYLWLNSENYYTDYQMALEYKERIYSSTGPTGVYFYNNENSCTLYSSVRNMLNVYDGYRNDPNSTFSTLSEETQNEIHNLCDNTVNETIKVRYLKEIDGTPFAEPINATINVRKVRDSTNVSYDQIIDCLGVDTVNVFRSPCFEFVYDSALDTYVADYLKSVSIYTKTVDGNVKEHFLDINKSYGEYFHPLVSAGAIDSDGAYEFIFARGLIDKYPELRNRNYSEVYGYFLYTVIPETFTLNTALDFLFDVKTKKPGVLFEYHTPIELSKTSYTALLDEFDYGYLENIWSTVWETSGDKANATAYLLYADPNTSEGGIFEDGSEDKDEKGGIIGGAIRDGVDGLGKLFSSIFGGASVIGILVLIVLAIIFLTKNNKKGNDKK